nr:hypothetical protein [Tanacetum cinerariifolium]
DDFLRQCNVNLARQVVMGSQLRLRFEQEAKLLRKSVAQVARRDKRIQAQELDIKNLEALLEAEADMKKAAEDKSAGLSRELEDMRAPFSDLQVSNERIAKGMSEGLRHGVEHRQAQLSLESIEAYDPEVHDLMIPWAYKEEMLLADAIAANISRAEKKKKCRIVCRTHGVGFAHHARSDGVLVSVPTVVP